MSVFPLLAILFLGFVSSTNAQTEAGSPTTTCLYKSAIHLTINPKHAGTKVNTCSQLSCIATHCKAVKHCAVSFHPETGQCLGVSSKVLETVPALSNSGQLFKASKDGWLVIVSGHMAFNKASTAKKSMKAIKEAAAFWPFDKKYQGRNLGTKGEALDLHVPGLFWDSIGPKGNASQRRFARFTKGSGGSVRLRRNGEYALNLTSFTIAAWIKRERKENAVFVSGMPGLSFGSNHDTIYVTKRIGYEDSKTYGTFKFNSNNENSWHHIAAVSEIGGKMPIIYVDGKPLEPSNQSSNSILSMPDDLPQKLFIGYFETTQYRYFVGGMACLFISEAALKPEEIKQLKNYCP